MNDAIEVSELTVTYGATVAVDRLSFTVGFGEVVGLLGPNGAGKTSTLETIEGYRRPTGGSVRVLGMDPGAKQALLARQMGVMLQEGGIPARMTVHAALGLYAKFYDHPEPIDELVARLDLGRVLKTPYRRLSGGEKQRLSLALALIGRPRVLLLDEPTAGVDPEGKAAIRELISELRAASVAILMTGHELEEIDRMVDRVLVVDHGTQRALGSPGELRQRFGGEGVEFSSDDELDLTVLARRIGAPIQPVRPGRYRVEAEATTQLLGHLVETLSELGIRAHEVATVTASLEDIYLQLIASPAATLPEDDRVSIPDQVESAPTVSARDADSNGVTPSSREARPILAQATSEVKMTLQQGEAALLTLVIPVLGLLVFGSVKFLPVPAGVPSRVNFILAGAIAFGIMASGMVSQSITVAFDRNYGVLKRLGVTPLGRGGIIAAKLAQVVVLELIQLVVLIIIATIMGYHPEGNPLVFLLGWVLATAAFTGLGLLIGGTLKAELVLGLSTLLWLLLLGVGSMAVPLTSLPGWLALIAKVLPAAGASEMILHGLAMSASVPVWAIVNLVIWGVGAPLLAIRFFRWS